MKPILAALLVAAVALNATAQRSFFSEERDGTRLANQPAPSSEFAFTRGIFTSGFQNLPGPGNSAWRDWPESDVHFIEGVSRLTTVDIDIESYALRFDDPRIFERPWLYALEVGTWLLTPEEASNLREYLLRGGFLVIDDFHGSYQWSGFERGMRMVFPDRPIVDIEPGHEIMSIMYDLGQDRQIAGNLALGAGVTYEHDGYNPEWKGIYDDQGRLMVMINHNMDLGDAWELADEPWYPEELTSTAYRFGVNYVVYSMTH